MKIVVCYKLVPEEQDISVKKDDTLDFSKAGPKISQFDLNAVEASDELKKMAGDSAITALSVGGKMLENSKARKDIMSRGPDDLALVIDEKFENMLPHQTARVLAAAAQKNGFDIILCGDGSGDLYAQQVGLQLGELLGVPVINGVSKLVSVGSGKVVVERALDDEVEVLELTLPAVIAVSADINTPRIPGMKAILDASKKPMNTMSAGDIGLGDIPVLAECLSVLAPKQKERLNVIIEGDGDDEIAAFANHLRKAMN